jgi:adenine/guanine phosphoribosyltransferase-like PRPP-binding protein
MSHTSASWLNRAVRKDGVSQIVKDSVKALKHIDFDTVAFRGISGALVAPIVAHKLKKEIALVRKPGQGSHSNHSYEGYLGIERFVIIDDLVCTGETIAATILKIRSQVPGAKFVGVYLYHTSIGYESPGFYTPDMSMKLFDRIKNYMNGESL